LQQRVKDPAEEASGLERQFKLQKDLSALQFPMLRSGVSRQRQRAIPQTCGPAEKASGIEAIQAAEGFERAPLFNAK